MAEETQISGAAATKKKKSSKLGLIIVIVLAAGCFIGGIVAGPGVLAKLHIGPPASASSAAEKEEEPAASTAALDAIVVDIREQSGEVHHLKVSIAIELNTAMKGEEFKKYEPRARDAIIAYLRSLTFEEVTSPTKFEAIRTALTEHVSKAIGKSNVHKVLFTDFVAQ